MYKVGNLVRYTPNQDSKEFSYGIIVEVSNKEKYFRMIWLESSSIGTFSLHSDMFVFSVLS